eukprot:scaffold86137_cov48-Phaeocystis_antarctica.AAC.2
MGMGVSRRGAAEAIMAKTKKGLGSEASTSRPQASYCTRGLTAAAPSTYGVGIEGREGWLRYIHLVRLDNAVLGRFIVRCTTRCAGTLFAAGRCR